MKLRVYLAGGMHGDWRDLIKKACPGHDYIDPVKHGLIVDEDYATCDVLGVKHCDVVLAYMEKTNPSGVGLAFEVGYALALDKTVILVNEAPARYFGIVEATVDNVCVNLAEAVVILLGLERM